MEKNLTPVLVVAAAIVRNDGLLLLHRRPEGKDHAGLWEFPGGKVEPGEPSRDALVREIAEECGIDIAAGSLTPISFAVGHDGASAGGEAGANTDCVARTSRRELVLLLFTTREFTGLPRSLEGGEWDWFSPADASDLPMPPLDQQLLGELIVREGAASTERGLPTL